MRVLIAHGSSKARRALADVVMRGAGRRLEVLDVEIITTENGAETLDLLLHDDPPEVALVDWDLPEIEGPEMCRLVRDFHHGEHTHLVVLASSRHDDVVDAWRAGAADCVSTPASPDVLWAAVEKGLHAAGTRRMRAVDVWTVCSPDEWASGDGEPDLGDVGPAALDALKTGDGIADHDDLDAAELSADLQPEYGPALRSGRREAEEPRGAALLQAVLSES